jgi:uncharacterized delta-60 repeat protein
LTDGTIDPQLQADSNSVANGEYAGTVGVQSDGSILVSGQSLWGIYRLRRDGTLDPGFVNGDSSDWGGVRALAVDRNDRVLAGGTFTTYDGQRRPCVARLLPNGHIDPSFHPGLGCSDALAIPVVNCVSIQPDGKILIAGWFTAVDGKPRTGLARLYGGDLPDGPPIIRIQPASQSVPEGADVSLYASAQSAGKAFLQWRFNGTDIPDATNEFLSLNHIKKPAAGEYTLAASNASGVTVSTAARLAVVVAPPQPGALDLTFDSGSGIAGEGWGDAAVRSVVEMPGGQLLVGGLFPGFGGLDRPGLVRLNPDGSPDATWPKTVTDGDVRVILPLREGGLLIGGYFTRAGQTNQAAVSKLQPDGSPDPAFLGVSPVAWGLVSGVYALDELPDGTILAGGVGSYYPKDYPWFTSQPPPEQRGIMRLLPNGTLDPAFNASWGQPSPDRSLQQPFLRSRETRKAAF